jgi:hypothetical protein
MAERQSCVELFKHGGGYYGGLREDVTTEELEGWVEVHHIPSREAVEASGVYYMNGGKLDDGSPPAILMDYNDHRLTASCGNEYNAIEYRKKQLNLINEGKFDCAQKMDIDDIRRHFGNKYDRFIDQAIEHTRRLHDLRYI